ncbi:MAG: hypothetical protein KF900_09340 [Bacteroidetes bacterium]|nr:hypothetical protein [Bacteroidota bacterium]
MKRNELIARYIALYGVRNTKVEDLHAGIFPKTRTGDYSDVKVVTPFGEIAWTEVSRISDKEMRVLMLDIEKSIHNALDKLLKLEKQLGSAKDFEKFLKISLYNSATWDLPESEMVKRYGKDYTEKL